jgi:uncharacterized protein
MAGREAHGATFVNQLSLFAEAPRRAAGFQRYALACRERSAVTRAVRYVYLHGFGSSPTSAKAVALQAAFARANVSLATPNVAVPTFATMTITAALEVIAGEDATARTLGQRLALIGSSMGGWMASLYAARHPERLAAMVLLCPGFEMTERFRGLLHERGMRRWKNRGSIAYPDADNKLTALHYGLFEDAARYEAMPAPPEVPVTIVHGRADDVVPVEVSRRYVERFPAVELVEVDDDHRLQGALPRVAQIIGKTFDLPLA